MPRKKLIRTNLYPYHVTARSNNKEFFDIEISVLWKILLKYIQKVESEKYGAIIPCFVLMNNHFHLLLWTPRENIDRVMFVIMKGIADEVNLRSGRMNHVFGGPYKWCLIRHPHYHLNVIRYICQNPLRAGLVEKVEHYPFLKIPRPADDQGKISDFLQWLNDDSHVKEQQIVKKALYYREFRPGRDPQTKRKFVFDLAPTDFAVSGKK